MDMFLEAFGEGRRHGIYPETGVRHRSPIADTDHRFRSRRVLCVLNLDGTDDSLVLQAEALPQRSGGELILAGVVPEIDEGMLLEAIRGLDRSCLQTWKLRSHSRTRQGNICHV